MVKQADFRSILVVVMVVLIGTGFVWAAPESGNCSQPQVPYAPDPGDGAVDVPIDTTLVWNDGGDNCSVSCGLANGGFENGVFGPWVAVTGFGDELTPWHITEGPAGALQNGAPFDGRFFAQNGFDGDAGLYYELYQEVQIPECATTAILGWSERIQWEMGGASLPREYVVSLQPAGGGEPLAILYSKSLQPNTSGDTGYVTHSVNLLDRAADIAGRTVRISFYEYISESYTGPAQFDLDGISLSCGNGQANEVVLDVPAGVTPIQVSEEVLEKYSQLRKSALNKTAVIEETYPPRQSRGYAKRSTPIDVAAQQEVLADKGSIIFYDDMESGTNGWTHYLISGSISDNWNISGQRAFNGITSWYSGRTADIDGDTALESPDIDLTGTTVAMLDFSHWYSFDDCDDPDFDPDGGIVEVRILPDGQWQQISPVGGYPETMDDSCGNPLAGLQAYTKNSGDVFVPAEFDLTGFIGNVIRIRFHVGWDCGNCEMEEGWYIDDVLVTGDVAEPSIYDLYLGTEESSLELIASDLTEPAFSPKLLECSSLYYWQVIAKNDCMETPGPVWSFRTTSCQALVSEVIDDKLEILKRISVLLEKERIANKGLERVLKSGDHEGLDKGDIVMAKQRIHSAIQHEEQAVDSLEKSVDKLNDALNALGIEPKLQK